MNAENESSEEEESFEELATAQKEKQEAIALKKHKQKEAPLARRRGGVSCSQLPHRTLSVQHIDLCAASELEDKAFDDGSQIL